MNKAIQIFLFLFFVSVFPIPIVPQTKQEITSCEEGTRKMDESLFQIVSKPNKVLLVVLRPNKKEKTKVVKSRTAIIENFCEKARGMKGKCIVSVGKQTAGLGAAEIYVEGELFDTIHYAKNASSFCVSP